MSEAQRSSHPPEQGRLSRELGVFRELVRAVGSGPAAAHELLDRICTQVRSSFGFQRAVGFRYRQRDAAVCALVVQGPEGPAEEWRPLGDFPFLQRAFEERRAVRYPRPEAEALGWRILQQSNADAIAVAPLIIDARCVGFVAGEESVGEFALDESDLQLLTALGWVTAVFLDKADQYGELERALAELRRLDEVKSSFVSVASHELRTPIAVVHGITSTLHLRGDELSVEQLRELRATLYEQTSRLSGLAEQLLDLSRIEAGALFVRSERFRPRESIDGLLPRIAPDRIADVDVTIEPKLELETDPNSFERIVSNLLINALLYGKPPVSVRAESNGRCRVVVEDRGDGISPEFRPRMFDRFAREENSRSRGGGAGLGLAIARSFAQALDADLVYEEAAPTGARFVLVLPESALP